MFSQTLTALLSSQAEPENVPVPRLYDALAEKYNANAVRAMRTRFPLLMPSDRVNNTKTVTEAQRTLRENTESLLWVSPNKSMLERLADLLGLLCAEYSWSGAAQIADDPAHPEIDLQAAETGVLIAWILRRHGAKLDENDPRVSYVAREQLRRRLFAPIVNHEDYPFMTGACGVSLTILCELLIAALLTERSRQRRTPPVKKLLRLIDQLEPGIPSGGISIADRLSEACALADTARFIKRMTHGEADLTARTPDSARLDDILSPYLGRSDFLDPCGSGIERELHGIDLYRLGYFCGDDAVRALGASLIPVNGYESGTVTGRILSMEYLQTASIEKREPPRLKRAVISDGTLMLTRCCGLTAAVTSRGNRRNAGDITLYLNDRPILCDLGGDIHSLPVIGGSEPIGEPPAYPCEDEFKDARDLISMDLTENYPQSCGINVYQRTLMLSRSSLNARLVEAFEFEHAPETIVFRFTCAERCALIGDSIRVGPMTLTWDGQTEPVINALEDGYLISLTYRNPPARLITGFGFELNDGNA